MEWEQHNLYQQAHSTVISTWSQSGFSVGCPVKTQVNMSKGPRGAQAQTKPKTGVWLWSHFPQPHIRLFLCKRNKNAGGTDGCSGEERSPPYNKFITSQHGRRQAPCGHSNRHLVLCKVGGGERTGFSRKVRLLSKSWLVLETADITYHRKTATADSEATTHLFSKEDNTGNQLCNL